MFAIVLVVVSLFSPEVAPQQSITIWQPRRNPERPRLDEPRGYDWQPSARQPNDEWGQQRQGYHANANSYDWEGQADCSGTIASKSCECTNGGKTVICRGTTFHSLQNDLPCPRNIQYLTLINPHFADGRCLTRDNMTNLPNLRSLIITGSNLEVLTREVFRGQPQLQVLDLRNNLRLETIDPDAFTNAPSLSCLDLSNNERLGNLPPTIFVKTTRLAKLNLSSIGLSELPQLPSNGQLKMLDISRNQLVVLPADFVQTFSRLDQIYLADNPWCCSRPTRWLSMFIRIVGDKTVVRDQPVCQGPNEVFGFPIKVVAPDQMERFYHCKGYSDLDDSRTCKEIYVMFRNVIPQLPTDPDNRISCNPQATDRVQDDQRVAEFEPPQRRPGPQPGFNNNGKNREYEGRYRKTTSMAPEQRALICLASVGGDCTTGNIIVGTIATVVGVGIVAAIIVIVRFVHRRRGEQFRTPSVL